MKSQVRIPHRGEWILAPLRYSIGDIFGLFRFEWEAVQSEQQTLLVQPPYRPHSPLPLFTSSSKSGEAISDVKENKGDLYDLKRYHPSDGIKRILWKAYARSGELVARKPERAITPEGKIALFILAAKQDDSVCDSALQFAEQVLENDLELIATCSGSSQTDLELPAHDPQSLRSLLISSVWHSEQDKVEVLLGEITPIIEAHQQVAIQLDRLYIFVGNSFFSSQAQIGLLESLAIRLAEQQISPIFCLEDGKNSGRLNNSVSRSTVVSKLERVIMEDRTDLNAQDETIRNAFMRRCFENQWQLVGENL